VNRYNNQLHKFAEGFPQFLNLDDQGLFIIGYHHMRHWLWMNKEEKKEWESEHSDAPRAYRSQDKPDTDPGNAKEKTQEV
jgi:hypothetical protein